jgi:hypothetical protein
MPNKKITAMPSLGGNQVPTDLVTAVDLSAAPVNQNVKSTLNDLFSTITKNITDRAIRFQAPGSAPAVSSANQGALYHNGTAFLASSNGGAYEPLYTLSAQSAAQVFAGPASGPAATPTFRSLALTDLPQIATASLLGRVSAGTGTPEQITSTAALLTWLQNPTSNNLSAAVTDATGAGGALVFAFGPVLNGPRFDVIGAATAGFGNNLVFSPSSGAVNFLEILNAVSGTGPTLRAAGSQTNVQLNLASKGTGIISAVGNQFRITGNAAGAAGILELRGGNASLSGGQIRLYEVTTNGTNYIGFQAPDILASNLLFELPATDGTAGQCLTTDGAGILSWATRGTGTVTSVGLSAPSIFTVANSPVTGSGTLALSLATQAQGSVFASPASGGPGLPGFRFLQTTDLPQLSTNTLLGRAAAGFGETQAISTTAALLTWIQSATSGNLRTAVTGTTGTGNLVFADNPALTGPTITSSNLNFTGLGQRILGNFSAAALADRLLYSNNQTDGGSVFGLIPNGAGFFSAATLFSQSNLSAAYQRVDLNVVNNSAANLSVQTANSGALIPLRISNGGSVRLHVEANGNLGINTTAYSGTSSVGVVAIADATTTPTSFPALNSGGLLYVQNGALRWRGPTTDTQIAPA